MPEELVLTPSQIITKYIAIPALNPHNPSLQIQKIKDKEVLKFDFSVKEQEVSKNYLFDSYHIFISGIYNPTDYDFYHAIDYQNGPSFATVDSQIFVNEERKSVPASIYIVAINKYTSKVMTARKVNFLFNETKKNIVGVKFEK